MSNLGPQQVNQSFSGLLQIPGGATSSLQVVQDGNGVATGLQVSTLGINAVQELTIAPTITGAPGTEASVTDTGTQYAPILTFTIPAGAAAQSVSTVAMLRAAANPETQGVIQTLGCVAAGDGGDGLWRWDASSTSADNTGTVVMPTGHVGAGRWLRLFDGVTVYPEWWGAKADGVTDDTAALQAALDYALTVNGKVLLSGGNYVVTDTLEVFNDGGFGKGIIIEGNRGGYLMARITWKKNGATDYILHLKGISWAQIRNLTLGVTDLSLYPFKGCIFVQTAQFEGGPASSGVTCEYLTLYGGTGSGSSCIQFGDGGVGANYQVSEVYCYKVVCVANSVSGNYTECGFLIGTSGNTKDMSFSMCGISNFSVAGFYWNGACSGWYTIQDVGGGQNGADFYCSSNGSINVIGGGTEASKKVLVYKGAGYSGGCATFTNYIAEALEPDDNYFIETSNHLTLNSCYFTFIDSDKRIKAGNGAYSYNSFPAIVSKNTYYEKSTTTVIPVEVYGALLDKSLGIIPSSKSVRIESTGDYGGAGGAIVPLQNIVYGAPITIKSQSCTGGYIVSNPTAPITYPGSPLSMAPQVWKYTISYAALKVAATSVALRIHDMFNMAKLIGCYAVVTEAFAHPTGTISLAVGYTYPTYNDFLVETNIDTTKSIGTLAADLGADLNPATANQGGPIVFGAPTSLAFQVNTLFKSSSGNLGNATITSLTAGSVDIYFVMQDFF